MTVDGVIVMGSLSVGGAGYSGEEMKSSKNKCRSLIAIDNKSHLQYKRIF